MSNPHNLVWLRFIQSVSNFGGGDPAGANNNRWAHVRLNASHDQLLGGVLQDLLPDQITYLSEFMGLIVVLGVGTYSSYRFPYVIVRKSPDS